MSRLLTSLLALVLLAAPPLARAAEPLRVFIRAGAKTHGPNQHDHPRFLQEWTKLLNDRGARTTGGMTFPNADQLAQTDVVVMYCQDGGMFTPEQKADLDTYLKRGGGIVVVHDAVCGSDADWFKTVIGGAWQHGRAKYFEGDISMYYVDQHNPITQEASNFDVNDELYYDLDLVPEAKVLAATWTPDARAQKNGRAFPHIYGVAPQMWTYEKDNYRAFVSIPGHNWSTFELPNFRAVLLRGIAWAGKRQNVDELCSKEELASLRYPPGGPTRPQEAASKIVTHPDFDIQLVAAEPLINKAMNVDWDPAGRMWVAETPEYPNGRRGMRPDYEGREWRDHGGLVKTPGKQERPGLDRISWLEDTNGDGVMDKKHVFYEGLELVTGLVFYKDGVIVTQAPDILWIRDTDGDGVGDKVETLYTGLGTGDTHAVINNPRWGFDGWIYATHGYSASQHVFNGDKSKDFGSVGSGVVRFKPDGSAIEQFSSKGGNTWGLSVTWDNEIVWTQPTSGDLFMHSLLSEAQLAKGKVEKTPSFKVVIKSPKSFPLMTWDQQAYRQIDWVGSFTAAAGAVSYDGGAWPKEWNDSYFTTEPTINILHQEFLKPEGISYAANKQAGREQTEFVVSKDLWFRPIEVRVGPDGALYVIDFYNQAVIHNDTRGPDHNKVNAAVRPDRDHYFGRIWRIMHKQGKPNTVPDLSKADASALITALHHPAQSVRMTAARLLIEKGLGADQLATLTSSEQEPAAARIQAIWALQREGKLTPTAVAAAVASKDEAVSRNALKAISEGAPTQNLDEALTVRLKDSDARTRLAAILALGATKPTPQTVQALLAAYPGLNDPWLQSAAIGVANGAPVEFLAASLAAPDAEALKPLVVQLAAKVRDNAADTGRVVAELAKPGSATIKAAILGVLGEGAASRPAPEMSPALVQALHSLLAGDTAAEALPLIVAWDKQGKLAADVQQLSAKLLATLNDASQPEEKRAAAITPLLATGTPQATAAVSALLTSKSGAAVQQRAIQELARTGTAETGAILVKAFSQLDPALQSAAISELLNRPEWARQLVQGIKTEAIPLTAMNPITLDRIRNYPDKAIAKEALAAIEAIRGPQTAAKDKVIAALLPQIEQGGDAAKGKAMFTGSCAVCHRFNGEGNNLAPELTGMGSHPRAELITHIVDPNREVDPSFAAWTFETKDGNTFVGIVTRENAQSVTVRDTAAEREIPKSNIKARTAMGRSLMPEGFEALGAETLRDVLAYLQEGSGGKFRVIDLTKAVDADGRLGLFVTKEAVRDNLEFTKYGHVQVGDVPFQILNPGSRADGLNLLVLKGGQRNGYSSHQPGKVEINVPKVQASALHFLGGVAGWGFPAVGEQVTAANVTVVYEGGKSERLEFKNGVEFADYIGRREVPGSQYVPNLVKDHQVRVFRKPLTVGGVVEKLVLESAGNQIAPVFVAITAEAGDKNSPAPNYGLAPAEAPAPKPLETAPVAEGVNAAIPQPPATAAAPRVLLVGGGSSHDFNKWFNTADRATLAALKPAYLEYTDNVNGVPAVLKNIDVLVWSANQPISSETAKALADYVAAGKGLVLLHPGVWYNWKNFPQWNQEIVGGGARGHDRFGEFEVDITDHDHPVTLGVTDKFKITDELYNTIVDPTGTPIRVLAQATSPNTGKTFPQVWIVQHPKARIAAITLGHDEKAHGLPEYQALLKNAVRWAGGK